MSGDTIAAEAEPLPVAAHPERIDRVPIQVAYEIAVADWTRVARSFVRSIQAYQEVNRVRARRLERPDPQAVTAVVAPVAEPKAAPPPSTAQIRPLTGRQFEIAELIARGLSNEEIAEQLVLTPGTVGNHVGHILRRLSARNRAQVATWVTQVAARNGPDAAP